MESSGVTPKCLLEGSGTFRKGMGNPSTEGVARGMLGPFQPQDADRLAQADARWVLGAHIPGCGESRFRSSLFYSCLPGESPAYPDCPFKMLSPRLVEKTAVAKHWPALCFHAETSWVHLHPEALFWHLSVVGIKLRLLMRPEECQAHTQPL